MTEYLDLREFEGTSFRTRLALVSWAIVRRLLPSVQAIFDTGILLWHTRFIDRLAVNQDASVQQGGIS